MLFLIVNSFHALGNACQYFVWYCVAGFCYSFYWIVFVEQNSGVVFFAVNICQVYHAHIHTDVAYDRSSFAVDIEAGFAVAEFSLQSVGISDRNDADA